MVFDLSDTERRTLGLEKPLSNDDTNFSEVYAGIKHKMMTSIERLIGYTELLDRMDDKNYTHAEAIKKMVLFHNHFEKILASIMYSNTMPAEDKVNYASMMFSLSVDYLSGQAQSDPIYEKLIMEPLKELRDNLTRISTSKYYQSKELAELSRRVNAAVKRKKGKKG